MLKSAFMHLIDIWLFSDVQKLLICENARST